MLCFARPVVAAQVALLHPTLWTIVQAIANGLWLEHTGQDNLVVTELFRTHDQTVALYTRAGLAAPAASVHESVKVAGDALSGCRGADLSVRMARPGLRYDEWPFLPTSMVRHLVRAVNERWRYQQSEQHQVALFHAVSGPHVHLQVRPQGETVRRVDGNLGD